MMPTDKFFSIRYLLVARAPARPPATPHTRVHTRGPVCRTVQMCSGACSAADAWQTRSGGQNGPRKPPHRIRPHLLKQWRVGVVAAPALRLLPLRVVLQVPLSRENVRADLCTRGGGGSHVRRPSPRNGKDAPRVREQHAARPPWGAERRVPAALSNEPQSAQRHRRAPVTTDARCCAHTGRGCFGRLAAAANGGAARRNGAGQGGSGRSGTTSTLARRPGVDTHLHTRPSPDQSTPRTA